MRHFRKIALIDIYLRIDKACAIFLKLFTNFPYSQNMFFLQITANSLYP